MTRVFCMKTQKHFLGGGFVGLWVSGCVICGFIGFCVCGFVGLCVCGWVCRFMGCGAWKKFFAWHSRAKLFAVFWVCGCLGLKVFGFVGFYVCAFVAFVC